MHVVREKEYFTSGGEYVSSFSLLRYTKVFR